MFNDEIMNKSTLCISMRALCCLVLLPDFTSCNCFVALLLVCMFVCLLVLS